MIATETASRARNGWIAGWDPEDASFWRSAGRRIARRNLAVSMFAEHLGFAVWVLWTVVVLNLGNAGIKLSLSALFVLTLLPNLIGSLLRIPYTMAVARLGGRAWTTISAALLIVPSVLLAAVVPSHWLAHASHATQLWILSLCAASSGVGGGNFASSMANISFFYPESRKGFALGLNAAGGNLGVATTQLLMPLVLIIGVPAASAKLTHHPVHLAYMGLVWIPFVVVAAALAWTVMDSLEPARSQTAPYRRVLSQPHLWCLALLYVGTFGSFIGFSFALPLVIKTSFPAFLAHHPFIATYLAGLGFLGALLGSLARPVGGWLADRWGGADVTLGSFLGMAGLLGAALVGIQRHQFSAFLGSFCGLFVLAGVGNGSIYKLIPAVFAAPAGASDRLRAEIKRGTAAIIGIIGAIGALGGVAVQAIIRQASLRVSALEAAAPTPGAKAAIATAHADWSVPAWWTFLVSYLLLGGLTWAVYLRRSRVLEESGGHRLAPAGAET
ncbi:MAG TPA: MFS transporter [Acidimicrobiales bacterium]|nr:MFS transporter [Acidimicrobiales bacterium]